MKLLRRRPQEAPYVRVRTRSGRTAHLQQPGHPDRVLCGWPTPHWQPADLSLDVCRLCVVAAQIEDERRAR